MGTLFRPKGVCAWGLGRRAGRLTAPLSCVPFRVCTSVVMLGREASLSVPPPVAAPQPINRRAAPAPATAKPRRRTHGSRRRQGSFAQQRQGATSRLRRRSRLRCSRRCLRSSGEAFRCFRFRELLGSEALDVLGGLPFHLHRPLPRPLQQGLHF